MIRGRQTSSISSEQPPSSAEVVCAAGDAHVSCDHCRGNERVDRVMAVSEKGAICLSRLVSTAAPTTPPGTPSREREFEAGRSGIDGACGRPLSRAPHMQVAERVEVTWDVDAVH